MNLTQKEKSVLSVLFALSAIGMATLLFLVIKSNNNSDTIMAKIQIIAEKTDKTPLVKGVYFNEEENYNKLNLNKTDLRSIKSIPGVSAGMAKAIYKFIHTREKKQIFSLDELLKIKGMTRDNVKHLENYVTVIGGHSGFKAWGDKLNLNFARETDLSALPCINEKTAKAIIEYRNSHGNFTYIEELLEVKQVSKYAFNKIKDMVCIQ